MLKPRTIRNLPPTLVIAAVAFGLIPSLTGRAFGQPDWSEAAQLPESGQRQNIYELAPGQFRDTVKRGKHHVLHYPVSVTGLLIPKDPFYTILDEGTDNPLEAIMRRIGMSLSGYHSTDDVYQWLGLSAYPESEQAPEPYEIPFPNGTRPDYRMGVSMIQTPNGEGITFSCAACHTTSLFGKPIMGLGNKRPRANEFFVRGKMLAPLVNPHIFQIFGHGSDGDREMFARTKSNMASVAVKNPRALGLDTSLSQVALSLARRSEDAYASKSKFYELLPRPNPLDHIVADSKPMPWFTLKYKTRWLSDGSIVSGNPIFTNILWNEIGRGTDLRELEQWLASNAETIQELTAAVFATAAPHWTDFFAAATIDLPAAKRGEQIFNRTCSGCHGTYAKAWSQQDSADLDLAELLKTTAVHYHKKTPVIDVGTDPLRYEGMMYFSDDLNRLAISQANHTKVIPQRGYVPPPLIGIWARYPYLHNGSVPTLCDLLTPSAARTQTFYQGPSDDIVGEYDADCVGYPTGDNTPMSWLAEADAIYDTSRTGQSNQGHEKMLLDANGRERLSPADKRDLLMFLKTL